MSRNHLVLFPDTNGLLHYPPLVDVDWLTVCDAKKVTIVFCMQVIHELDEKKNDPRLTGRAERVIREINRIRKSGNVVRDNVFLEIFNHELRANEFTGSLSPDSGDDRIVHLVKQYVETTGQQDVAVYSEDLGMSLRCEACGIELIEPDKSTRLESPQTEQDRKYKAVVTELNAIKAQAPVIQVRIAYPEDEPDDTPFVLEITRQLELVDPAAAVEDERKRLWQEAELESEHSGDAADALMSAVDEYTGWDKRERERYEREATEYIRRYRLYAEETNSFKDVAARMFAFKIHIVNSGSCPATDTDVVLTFPPILQFIVEGRDVVGALPKLPEKPEPPKPPQRGLCWPGGIQLADLSMLRPEPFEMPVITPRGAPWAKLNGNMKDGFSIRIHIPSLKHHNSECFGEFVTMFKTWDDMQSFQVVATVTAGNLIDKLEWQIPFLVKVAG